MIKAILLAAAKITEYCQLITGVSRKATMALIKRIELPGQRCILGDWKLYVQNYHEESWIFASLSNIDSEMAHKISTTDVRAALNQGRNSHDYGNTHIRSVNRKYKDYVYRKMLVQEYLKKWRIFKRVKPKNDMMYHDIYNCICQNTKK